MPTACNSNLIHMFLVGEGERASPVEVGNSAQVQVQAQHVGDAAEDDQSESQDDAVDEDDNVNPVKQSKLPKAKKKRRYRG